MITTEQIKELRDATGVSVMQCKKALEESAGDMEKALMILKKKSSEIAAKKSDREASEGFIVVKKGADKAVILELNCETDFVAKNSDFMDLANALADKALTLGVESMSAESEGMISPVIQKIGENIKLGRVESVSGSVLGSYIHDGKSGVLVSLEGGDEVLAKDIAMHIAAMKPEYMSKEEVPAETIEKAKELFQKEVEESNKPEEIKQKMLEGKISSYFKEQSLLDQAFIKNPDMTISALLSKAGAKIVKYVRISIR
jgi:elongation factor Ts